LSGIVGLLALLLGFTFALAVDRFEARRLLVLEEANAIRAAFVQAQTFEAPYRDRLDTVLAAYAENRLRLGQARQGSDEFAGLLARNHELKRMLWASSLAAVAPSRDDVSASYLEAMRDVLTVGAERRAAREAHVPLRVFELLLIYMIAASGTLGYVMGPRRRPIIIVMIALTTLSYVLILDIDGATGGGIKESQQPMAELIPELAAGG
jgi:hypothetical protein